MKVEDYDLIPRNNDEIACSFVRASLDSIKNQEKVMKNHLQGEAELISILL